MAAEESMGLGKQALAVAVVAILALGAGLLFGTRVKQDPGTMVSNLEQATVLGTAATELPNFALRDHTGAAFDAVRLIGHWSLVFFGYTHCPDICPVTLNTVHQAIDGLAEPLQADAPHVFFVSVDPDRDTAERLREYVTYFDPRFLGVTGDPTQLNKLTRGLGVAYARADGQADGYFVDHSASLLLVSPDGRLYAVLSAPHDQALITRNLSVIIEAYQLQQG